MTHIAKLFFSSMTTHLFDVPCKFNKMINSINKVTMQYLRDDIHADVKADLCWIHIEFYKLY